MLAVVVLNSDEVFNANVTIFDIYNNIATVKVQTIIAGL